MVNDFGKRDKDGKYTYIHLSIHLFLLIMKPGQISFFCGSILMANTVPRTCTWSDPINRILLLTCLFNELFYSFSKKVG